MKFILGVGFRPQVAAFSMHHRGAAHCKSVCKVGWGEAANGSKSCPWRLRSTGAGGRRREGSGRGCALQLRGCLLHTRIVLSIVWQPLFANCWARASCCERRSLFRRWASVEKLAGCVAETEAACHTDNERKVCARCLKETGKEQGEEDEEEAAQECCRSAWVLHLLVGVVGRWTQRKPMACR